MRAPKATMLARRRCGCSSHRPLAPVPLFLQSQRHSTALPSAKRYDNRYGAKWKSNFREYPECELRLDGVLRSSLSDLTQSFQGVVHLGDALGRKQVLG